jgi:competence ComEA-like helix-hairpin-helix protein
VAARDERRAVLVLAVVAALGGVVRVVRSPAGPPGASVVAPELRGGDLARQAELARRAEASARPLLPGERVDADTAGAEELARLPRVGPKLARRIVEERDARGPFGSLEGLRRVAGIGPAMLAALERSVLFSGVPRPQPAGSPGAAASGPGAGARPAPRPGREACPAGLVPLNDATPRELECLKGVGPALAARIVADRTLHGRFGTVEDLDRVPGVGRGLVERLRPSLRVP